jgi:hypothetical protein
VWFEFIEKSGKRGPMPSEIPQLDSRQVVLSPVRHPRARRHRLRLRADGTERLALDWARIIGLKDSSWDFPRFWTMLARIKPQQPDFVCFSGTEEILYPTLVMGADGGTIARSGVMPEVITKLYRVLLAGSHAECRRGIETTGIENLMIRPGGNVVSVKSALDVATRRAEEMTINRHKIHFDLLRICRQRAMPLLRKRKPVGRSQFGYWTVLLLLAAWVVGGASALAAGQGTIHLDAARKVVMLTDGQGQLALRLNYDARCILDQIIVRGHEVAAESGVASGIRVDGQWFTTQTGIGTPSVAVGKDTLTVSGIVFGKPGSEIVHETWLFTVQSDCIVWRITRKYSTAATLEDAAFPEWDFSRMSTWTGGMLDDGGVVWNKYLETPNATYGAHAGTVTFWNREQNDCLRIIPSLPKDQYETVRFSHQTNGVFSFNYVVSGESLKPKHDLCRFLSDHQDLWAPFPVKPGKVSVGFTLKALNYNQAYDRGTFKGLDGGNIGELLNTVARYGVIDSRLVGGNGWRSGYICLHEQWFGEIGLALDEPDYIANYSKALDYYRDHAINPDGRVKSRWCYGAWDAMPGTYDKYGFYEAQWGYLLDSQPDYVIDVAEQFNLTGDRKWLAGQKTACEKALDFLMRREIARSGLAAMMTDSLKAHKSSDWIDVVWASYENALVNAELYEALKLWAGAEDTLGDAAQAETYRDFAARLKNSFNRPISEGGFWDPTNQWYVYWRDKDGSIHGDNLVTPVNFTAIAYGICDDAARQNAILDRMETEMKKEKLFSWPLCFFPYAADEGVAGTNFPSYENGDLFLSWDEVGVRAYAAHDPALALKYVKKTLARYDEDGLSFQRYLRQSQRGEGGDILAGNCMAIVGLYRDIYGVQPKPNRLYLDPHLTDELNGTKLRYTLRGQLYEIDLNTKGCAITAGVCTLRDSHPFGVNATITGLEYFPGTDSDWALSISRPTPLTVQIENWPNDPGAPRQWTESSPQAKGTTLHVVSHLRPNAIYKLKVNGQMIASFRADKTGCIRFNNKRGCAAPQKFELDLATEQH